MKLAKRKYGYKALPYFCVFEATKRGEPHLHILARVKWLDQAWLSAQMARLTDAPIVDIRTVRSQRQVANYVSKYVGKAPHRFATCKRYWQTRDWTIAKPGEDEVETGWSDRWQIVPDCLDTLEARWATRGYAVTRGKHHLRADHTGPPWWQQWWSEKDEDIRRALSS